MDRDHTAELENDSILPDGQQDAPGALVERNLTPEKIEASISLALEQPEQEPQEEGSLAHTEAEIEAFVALHLRQEEGLPAPAGTVNLEVVKQPVSATQAKQNPFWGQLADAAKDEHLIKWRDQQVELNPDACIEGTLDDAVQRIQAWRDSLVHAQADPQGRWGERAAYGSAPSVSLASNRLIISRDRALRTVTPSRTGSARGISEWARGGDSSMDLLVIGNNQSLDDHILAVQQALETAGAPYISIAAEALAKSDFFHLLFEKCNRNSELFGAGTIIITHLERLPWKPDSFEQLRRACEDLRSDSSLGYWAVPANLRSTVAIYASIMADAEELVPTVIRKLFKRRQVLDNTRDTGTAHEGEREAS